MDLDLLCDTMRRLAVEAGEAIMAIRAEGDLGVEAKADASPVTRADLAADRLISAGLRAAFPGVPLVTEEQAATHGGQDGGQKGTFLIVDPLDGTKEFVRQGGDFTVNIALVRDGVPVRGVVFAPARARLFYTDAAGAAVEEAAPAGGAIEAARAGVARALAVAAPDNAALRVVASRSHRDAATDAWIARLRVSEFVAAGSSLKFCLVAAGEADLYPRLGRTMEWDTAAGQAVLLGAGGQVLRLDDGQPLFYGKPGHENPHFVALAPGVELT